MRMIADRLPFHESSRLCFATASRAFFLSFGFGGLEMATTNTERLASGILASINIAFAASAIARSGDPIVLQIWLFQVLHHRLVGFSFFLVGTNEVFKASVISGVGRSVGITTVAKSVRGRCSGRRVTRVLLLMWWLLTWVIHLIDVPTVGMREVAFGSLALTIESAWCWVFASLSAVVTAVRRRRVVVVLWRRVGTTVSYSSLLFDESSLGVCEVAVGSPAIAAITAYGGAHVCCSWRVFFCCLI